MRDQHRAPAFQPFEPHHLVAAIGKEASDLRVGYRHVGGHDADAFDIAVLPKRLAGSVRAHRDLDPSALLDALAQPFAPFEPVPEGFGRHAHDQMVGFARHHPVDRRHQLAANGLDQRGEIAVVADRVVRDVDTAEMVRHAARTHRVKFRLHRGVGAGRDDAELYAPTERVGHFAAPVR